MNYWGTNKTTGNCGQSPSSSSSSKLTNSWTNSASSPSGSWKGNSPTSSTSPCSSYGMNYCSSYNGYGDTSGLSNNYDWSQLNNKDAKTSLSEKDKSKISRDKCREKKREEKEERGRKIQNLTSANQDLRNKINGYQQKASFLKNIFDAHANAHAQGMGANNPLPGKFQRGRDLVNKYSTQENGGLVFF